MKGIFFLAFAALLTSAAVAQNTFTNNGTNVGIGTASPTNLLNVVTPTAITPASVTTYAVNVSQAGSPLALGGDASGSYLQSFNSKPLKLNAAGNNVLLNSAGIGSVGIGTASPLAALHVVTPSGAAGIIAQSTVGFSAGSGAFLRLYNSGTPTAANQRLGGLLMGTNPSGTALRTGAQIDALSEAAWTDSVSQPTFMRFLTTENGKVWPEERMRITADGNVGIGTAAPGAYKLAVEGTIGARRVKVQQGTWADFVFDSDYKLPSLAEVELYIKANRHLPEIQSAAEVEKEGLDLGEMNKKLLQKVEELTLYMIELNKQNLQLKNEIETIKSRIR